MAPAMDQERGEDDKHKDLEELGLPILESRLTPVPEIAVRSESLRNLSVLLLLTDELCPSHPGLERPARQEQADQCDAEAIVPPHPVHVRTSKWLLGAVTVEIGRA